MVRVEDIVHNIIIIIIMLTVICIYVICYIQNILRTITRKEVLILVTNIFDQISLESVRIFFVSIKALKI